MIEWLAFAAIGVLAGLSAGLLGLGGGAVVVPALVLVFSWQGLFEGQIMHVAVATSLMTIIITSLSSIYAHQKYNHINWSVIRSITPGLIIGSLIGVYLATMLTSDVLKRGFAIYILLVAIRMWLPATPLMNDHLLKRKLLALFGIITGGVSAMVGIGGGSIVVPYLVFAKQTMQHAIGSATACGFVIAVTAVTGFIIFSVDNPIEQNKWQLGYIYWPAFLGIISTSMFFSLVGAKLARKYTDRGLKQLFSLALVAIGVYMYGL